MDNKIGKFIWMDMEFSGTNPKNDKILEIAFLITDKDLNELEAPQVITIQHDLEKLKFNFIPGTEEKMKTMFKNSGILERVKKSKTSLVEAENIILNKIEKHCVKNECFLAGSSIWSDASFLREQMPKIKDFLHYRLLDVSSLLILRESWYPNIPEFEKKYLHDSLLDIKETVNQLKYYKNNILR